MYFSDQNKGCGNAQVGSGSLRFLQTACFDDVELDRAELCDSINTDVTNMMLCQWNRPTFQNFKSLK